MNVFFIYLAKFTILMGIAIDKIAKVCYNYHIDNQDVNVLSYIYQSN